MSIHLTHRVIPSVVNLPPSAELWLEVQSFLADLEPCSDVDFLQHQLLSLMGYRLTGYTYDPGIAFAFNSIRHHITLFVNNRKLTLYQGAKISEYITFLYPTLGNK